jgi:large subunit ribosomal protein L1|tara:strand:- start:9940 stop:10257 length:318 start_codon:yes stop_codon:yes gene_type:complete
MPSPKAGAVTVDIKEAITEFKSGKLEYRADRTGILHSTFGKFNFLEEDLLIILQVIQESIDKNNPSDVKGNYRKSFSVTTLFNPLTQMQIYLPGQNVYFFYFTRT